MVLRLAVDPSQLWPPGKHVERMAVRAKYMTLDPNKNKYVKNMRNIRWIQVCSWVKDRNGAVRASSEPVCDGCGMNACGVADQVLDRARRTTRWADVGCPVPSTPCGGCP